MSTQPRNLSGMENEYKGPW